MRRQEHRARVFVTGPYTSPDPVINTRNALAVGNDLLNRGYVPYVPHANLLTNLVYPRDYKEWVAHGLEMLPVFDAVLRLAGESKGADLVIGSANSQGIPVFSRVSELIVNLPVVVYEEPTTGAELIAKERENQISKKGYDQQYDKQWTCQELPMTAAGLCCQETMCFVANPDSGKPLGDPWGLEKKHADDRIRQLTIAGALIAAEIDRLKAKGGESHAV